MSLNRAIETEKKKIFIVEDDLVLLETIQDILLEHGYDCMGCDHPDEAVRMIEVYRPDLVLWDYMLPEWSGGGTFQRDSGHR